jgi:hypothetical protein
MVSKIRKHFLENGGVNRSCGVIVEVDRDHDSPVSRRKLAEARGPKALAAAPHKKRLLSP